MQELIILRDLDCGLDLVLNPDGFIELEPVHLALHPILLAGFSLGVEQDVPTLQQEDLKQLVALEQKSLSLGETTMFDDFALPLVLYGQYLRLEDALLFSLLVDDDPHRCFLLQLVDLLVTWLCKFCSRPDE